MMMLLILTGVLGYELKTAVGTSVFIMAFTALTGAVSHFAIGGAPELWPLVFCVLSTLLWALIAACLPLFRAHLSGYLVDPAGIPKHGVQIFLRPAFFYLRNTANG